MHKRARTTENQPRLLLTIFSALKRKRSSLLLLPLILTASCESCAPQTGVQQLQAELATTCSFQQASVQRATQNPASSTQPSIAALREGHVLAWIDDREVAPTVVAQRFDAMLSPQEQPRPLKTGPNPHRPRVATSGEEILILSMELSNQEEPSTSITLLSTDLEQEISTFDLPGPGPEDVDHAPGLAFHKGRYVVGYAREGTLNIVELDITGEESPGEAGPAQLEEAGVGQDASARADDVPENVRVGYRTLPFGEGITDLGQIDLLSHEDGLFLAADHPEGWSIVIAQVGDTEVTRFSQVLDDRRNPNNRWCCPAIGRAGEHLAIMWQGPGLGLATLYFLEFDLEGNHVGSERPFEGIARDDEDQPIGRAPVFSPALAPTTAGLIAAFADNRFSNTEILLASFSCGGVR